jgi:hypothetical protein
MSQKWVILVTETQGDDESSYIDEFMFDCVEEAILYLGVNNYSLITYNGLFEKIFMQTIENNNETFLYGEFLKYVTKQTKDYFLMFKYEKTATYELIDGKINSVTAIIGINEKFSSIEKTPLTEKESIELLSELKELELDTTTNENLALALLELETEKSEIYELLRIYTMYISLSVGIYLDDKQKRNERKSSKRNGTADVETEPTKLKRVQ